MVSYKIFYMANIESEHSQHQLTASKALDAIFILNMQGLISEKHMDFLGRKLLHMSFRIRDKSLKNQFLGISKIAISCYLTDPKLDAQTAGSIRSNISALPDFESQAVLASKPSIDPVQAECLVHDANNVLFGLSLSGASYTAELSALLNIGAAIPSYLASPDHLKELEEPLISIGENVAAYFENYLNALPAETVPPQLYEMRSIMNDLVGVQPVIERIDLEKEISGFLSAVSFRDKNSGKVVSPEIITEGIFPFVLADKGILFRTIRNLLNDIATHAASTGNTIPARITLSQYGSVVNMAICNPGELDDKAINKIGFDVYSRTEQREHGWGKRSISLMFDKMLRQINIASEEIEQILKKQWTNTRSRFEGDNMVPSVRWTMPFYSAV
jgi:hypothetical protein